jgi:hypothetical protein
MQLKWDRYINQNKSLLLHYVGIILLGIEAVTCLRVNKNKIKVLSMKYNNLQHRNASALHDSHYSVHQDREVSLLVPNCGKPMVD